MAWTGVQACTGGGGGGVYRTVQGYRLVQGCRPVQG